MQSADIISSLALGLAGLSLAWQVRTWLADRTKVFTRSNYWRGDDEGSRPQLHIQVAVDGPRAVVMRMLVMKFADGHWSGEYLGEKGRGLRLADGEHFSRTLEGEDLAHFEHDIMDIKEAVDFYFEDSLGRRYPIKDCRENIIKINAENKTRRVERKVQDLADPTKAIALDNLSLDNE